MCPTSHSSDNLMILQIECGHHTDRTLFQSAILPLNITKDSYDVTMGFSKTSQLPVVTSVRVCVYFHGYRGLW